MAQVRGGQGGRGKDRRPVEELKREVLRQLANGSTVVNAMLAVDRSVSTYEAWCKNDPEFRAQRDRVRGIRQATWAEEAQTGEFPDFAEFSKRYLDAEVFPHMNNVVDLIERREPSFTHRRWCMSVANRT